jgi:hypothetical protein
MGIEAEGVNTLATLNGLYKKVYDGKLENLIPDGVKLLNAIKFVRKEKRPGADYNQSVILGMEHGVSFAAPDEGAFALNPAIAGTVKQANIKGYQMVLRSAMAFDTMFAADSAGERAFEEATKYIFQAMMDSISKKLEIRLLYGQSGLAKIDSASGNVITIEASEWAPGIWGGSENMRVSFVKESDGSLLTGDAKIVEVDFDAKTIKVDALPSAVTTELAASGVVSIYEYGSKGKEMAGIHKIISNSGELFGISAASYSLWKGNSHSCQEVVGGSSADAPLTFNKLAKGLAKPVAKGLQSEVTVYVSPSSWADLMTEQAGSRRFDVSYKSGTTQNGSEALEFFSQNGKMTIVASIFVKQGYAYAINHEQFLRVGSSDLTFKNPLSKDDFFHLLENNAGVGIRCYTNQALFCTKIGHQLMFTGISA